MAALSESENPIIDFYLTEEIKSFRQETASVWDKETVLTSEVHKSSSIFLNYPNKSISMIQEVKLKLAKKNTTTLHPRPKFRT